MKERKGCSIRARVQSDFADAFFGRHRRLGRNVEIAQRPR